MKKKASTFFTFYLLYSIFLFSPGIKTIKQYKAATAAIHPPAYPISPSNPASTAFPPIQVPLPIPRLKIPEKIDMATAAAPAGTH